MERKLRQQLLQEGMKLLEVEGIDAFSMRKVAKQCGVSSAAPYKYFQSNAYFFSAISKLLDEQLMEEFEKVDVNQGNKELHIAYGIEYVQFLLKYPYLSSALFWGDANEEEKRSIQSWRSFKSLLKPIHDYFEENKLSKEMQEYYYFSFQTVAYGTQHVVLNNLLRSKLDIRQAVRQAYLDIYESIEQKL